MGDNSRPIGTSSPSIAAEPEMYAALAARVSATESTLATLQDQVAKLSQAVKSLSDTSAANPKAAAAISTFNPFSPFDSPIPAAAASNDGGVNPRSPGGGQGESASPDPSITVLTQQISALSTSVAQLQRLQSQSHLARPSSNPSLGVVPPSPAHIPNGHLPNGLGQGQGQGQPRQQGPGPIGSRSAVQSLTSSSVDMLGQGPASATGSGMLSPMGREFVPPQLPVSRTPANRSFSSSLLGGEAMDKWAPPGSAKYGAPGSIGGAPLGGGLNGGGSNGVGSGLGGGQQGGRESWPSPGPGGLLAPGSGVANGPNTGAAAPGAGIVVTKWEHLNLKVELLRSISKYGIGPPNKIQARVLPFMLKGSDIIAQAPPTQERIISYVIPALQMCLSLPPLQGPYRGPAVIIITTTVDQATQCHKLVRNVGGPLGVRSALAAGAAGSGNLSNELATMQREAVQVLIGTPAKTNEVMNARGGLSGAECRLLILDEVDQLIARNLYENVLNVARVLPAPRRPGSNGSITPGGPVTPSMSYPIGSPFDNGQQSPFNPASKTPFPTQPSRFGTPGPNGAPSSPTPVVERQTCIFSNTIPTDVINFSQSLQVRDPVRVLVRREGNNNSQESVSSVTPGINLKHTYAYLTITGSARSDDQSTDSGPGTIGSGRATAGGMNEEATRAKEYKLDMLVKMLDDYPLWQAIIHVGTYSMLEAVVFKLSSRQWDTCYLATDMPPSQKKAVMQQWRLSMVGNGPRFLVCFDVNPKPPDIPWAPLIINFDLPRSVEGYALRAAAAVPPPPRPGQQPQGHVNGVIVSFVQAAGGDVEMLRSTECAYRFKSAEIPTVFHDLFQL